MTGGFALNCPTNTYIMKKFGFKAFSTCPCVSDTGIALGIGLYEFFMKMGYFEFALDSAYHGSVSTKLVEDLDAIWLRYIEGVTDFDGDRFVNDIIDKPLVWFEGSSEIGPRALGARSILGDPRTEKTRDILNVIKQRQWWRPVAPIIIDEEKEHWFNNTFSSPYMLCTAICKMDKVSFIPAALHLDYSARIQTISDNSSYLYRAISAFYDKTGVPLICNTSLNDKGEPIIDTIEQCLNFALKKNINIIYYNGKRIEIKNHIEYEQDMVLERNIEWVQLDDQDIINAKRILNPYNLSSEELDLYLNFPELFLFDVTDEKQVNQLKKVVNYWKKLNNSFWTKLLD